MATSMDGPLGPMASGIAEELKRLGYAERTADRQMSLVAGLSRFLQRRGVSTDEVNPGLVAEFCATLSEKSRGWRPTPRALAWLVRYLCRVGATTIASSPPPRSPVDDLLGEYRRHLLAERGLADETVALYVQAVLPFVREHVVHGLDKLVAADVSAFVTRECRAISGRAAERLATGLRSFLGFALLEGMIPTPLAGAVPSAARWSGASLPRGLAPEQLRALLASCDRSRATGTRDYAILVVLSRLGLRAAEVAALRLDDIDWRAAEIVVRGKGRTEARLPLPFDVGQAVVAYLRQGRPRRPERELFLRAAAPVRGLSPDGVSEVVRAAGERAGLGSFGAHRLRHTAGTNLLRAGATLPEVAQVLRHRSVATTTIYAKVDHRELSRLAMAWPGGTR